MDGIQNLKQLRVLSRVCLHRAVWRSSQVPHHRLLIVIPLLEMRYVFSLLRLGEIRLMANPLAHGLYGCTAAQQNPIQQA